MNDALPVIAAGGTFAGSSIAGLLIGIWVAHVTRAPLCTFGGLLVGLGIGAYGAVRLLVKTK